MNNPYKFKKGMRVVKVYTGTIGGIYREATAGVITKVDKKKGVVYFNGETGITYRLETGNEIENFFPGMSSVIIPLLE